jgi:hypothetical protein
MVFTAFGVRSIELSSMRLPGRCVNSNLRFFCGGLDTRRRAVQGEGAMTTASTRIPGRPLGRAAALALVLIVIIIGILPL